MLSRDKNNLVREYADYRGELIARGTSLYQWAKRNKYAYTTVVHAARGERSSGRKSPEIRRKLDKFLGAKKEVQNECAA